jgi:molybdopterin-guanine dinucleotide biosynthesis adapter protein
MMRLLGVAGYSGSGKTTLIEGVLPLLVLAGLRVSVIKHAHHAVDLDTPGKDSWRHREAGAFEVIVASERRWALMHELRGHAEPDINGLAARLAACDLVLVEGFKREAIPKIEVYRRANASTPLYLGDRNVLALCTDAHLETHLPVFELDDYAGVATFIMHTFMQGS